MGCGGALISSNKVITVATCVKGKRLRKTWTIKAGNIKKNGDESSENVQIKQVKAMHISPLVNNSHYLFYY